MDKQIYNGQTIIAFPPSGFGFWYYLGQYKQIENNEYKECIGASSGTILCLCTLLDKDKQTFEFLKELAFESLYEFQASYRFFNLHIIIRLFVDKLYSHIDWQTVDFSKLKIIISRINNFTISRREIVPQSKEQLKELIFASSFVPILSNYNGNYFYYEIDHEIFIDGWFVDFYIPSKYFLKTQSINSLYMPTTVEEIYKSYLKGLNSKLTIVDSPTDHSVYLINPLILALLLVFICFSLKT